MEDYFDPWRPLAANVQPVRDFPADSLYSPQSPPLALPGGGGQHSVLPLFHSTCSTGRADTSQEGFSSDDVRDSVAFVGGPVWALGWCPADVPAAAADPAAAGPSSAAAAAPVTAQYLAVGCHPLQTPLNLLGKAVSGPALIQLWEAISPEQPGQSDVEPQAPPPPQQQQQQVEEGDEPMADAQQAQQQHDRTAGLRPPEMALGIAHDGGLTWHLRWCLDPGLADALAEGTATAGGRLPRLGLLAAALGDGSVRIWAVPHPRAVRQQLGLGASGAAAQAGSRPPIVSLDPVVAISSQQLGGSMPSVLDWLPAKPHDLLAVGCWDGNVAVIKLAPGRPPGQPGWELLSFFPAEPLPVRALQWVPPVACGETLDLVHRHLFLTAGHAGDLRIWDDRDQLQPLFRQILTTTCALGAVWTSAPFGVTTTLEDGSLRGVPLDSAIVAHFQAMGGVDKSLLSVSWRGTDMGAMWALDVHPILQLVAYGGEGGEVGVFVVEYEESRKRAPHTPIAGLSKVEDVLVVKGREQLLRSHGLYAGRVVERQSAIKGARLPAEEEAVHRVAWHPGVSARGAWLASGGAAGLVRLQWVERR